MVAPAPGCQGRFAPFPSLRSVTAPAVRRDAPPKSRSEGAAVAARPTGSLRGRADRWPRRGSGPAGEGLSSALSITSMTCARGGSGGYCRPVLRGALPARYPGMVAGDRRRPAASTRIVEPEDMTDSPRWLASQPIQDAPPPNPSSPETPASLIDTRRFFSAFGSTQCGTDRAVSAARPHASSFVSAGVELSDNRNSGLSQPAVLGRQRRYQ